MLKEKESREQEVKAYNREREKDRGDVKKRSVLEEVLRLLLCTVKGKSRVVVVCLSCG